MTSRRIQHRTLRAVVVVCGWTLPAAALAGQDSAPPAAAETVRLAQASPTPAADTFELEGLHWIDGAVMAVYACAVVGLGWYFSRRQKSTEEYFVGNRTMNSTLIGFSLFATLLSTISYLSVPGEMIKHGPVILTDIVAVIISYFIVGYWLVPVYMQHRVTSVYELLEDKLGIGVRLMGAVMFIVLRLLWMSLLIYFSSKALVVILGLGPSLNLLGHQVDSLQTITIATGAVAVVYASLGGLRAVVITDVLQTVLLFGGAILVIATVSMRLGGFDWFPTSWDESWDRQPLFSVDPAVRVTVFGTILTATLWWLCTAGGDQTVVQRFMATRDTKSARKSFLTNSIAGVLVTLVLSLVGFALLGYFKLNPDQLPAGLSIDENADLLFPHFISHHLPAGLSGLVISGMFAAAMSSFDSGLNSISAVVLTDFVDRFKRRPLSELAHVRLAKMLAFAVGSIAVLASSLMEFVPGNFLEMTKRTNELFVAPLFVLLFLALFVPFASPLGALAGALAGLVVAVLVAFPSVFPGVPSISFQYILPLSLITAVSAGSAVSWLGRRPR